MKSKRWSTEGEVGLLKDSVIIKDKNPSCTWHKLFWVSKEKKKNLHFFSFSWLTWKKIVRGGRIQCSVATGKVFTWNGHTKIYFFCEFATSWGYKRMFSRKKNYINFYVLSIYAMTTWIHKSEEKWKPSLHKYQLGSSLLMGKKLFKQLNIIYTFPHMKHNLIATTQ